MIDSGEANAAAAYKEGLAEYRRGRLGESRLLCEQALCSQPRHSQALHLLGVIALQSNDPQQAVEMFRQAILIDPQNAMAYNNHGNALQAMRQWEAAIAIYDRAIALKPDYAEAYYNRGNAFFDLARYEAAIESYGHAVARSPDYSPAHCNRGLALFCLGQYAAAVASYDKAIAVRPNSAEAYNYRGNALQELRQFQAALDSYGRAIALEPDYAEAHNGRGSALAALERYEPALESCGRAIAIQADFAAAYLNRGNVLRELRRWAAALEDYGRAIAIKPDFAEALLGRGNVQRELKRWEPALADCDQALAIKEDFAEAHVTRGNVFRDLNRFDQALDSYGRAIAIKADLAEAYYGRGDTRLRLGQLEAAAADYDCALERKAALKFLPGLRRHVRMRLCDWRGLEEDLAQLAARIDGGEAASPPFPIQSLSGSPALQRRAAEIWVREECPADPSLGAIPRRERHEKIRIGYFSADFRNHPVSLLTAELFETHDRSRFEITAFSTGPDTQDEMRARLKRAFDRFIDVRERSDADVALLARNMELDIAVDLGGFTEGSRPGIFALRAAPLQVSYIGYLGTMGAPYIDYLIADDTIVPSDHRRYYSEKILYLPSYQANDSRRRIAERPFTREELGLPPAGFVFCCFNSHYKITPATFAGWTRILGQLPGSTLFLYDGGPSVVSNLRKEAGRGGVDPSRLVFGRALPIPDYLARYRAADLFLDTLPYNAGTTASDALWAGLPVLTCTGGTFAGRVAASLLTAIDLPELITSTPERYEALAVELAREPSRLAKIKQRLADHRLTTPLFDIRLFTRNLEAAYTTIHERHRAGLAPEDTYGGVHGGRQGDSP